MTYPIHIWLKHPGRNLAHLPRTKPRFEVARSRWIPHQGKREAERRLRQAATPTRRERADAKLAAMRYW